MRGAAGMAEDEGNAGFWFGLLLAGAAAYLLLKSSEVPCPVCQRPVKKGAPMCTSCGIGLNWNQPSTGQDAWGNRGGRY